MNRMLSSPTLHVVATNTTSPLAQTGRVPVLHPTPNKQRLQRSVRGVGSHVARTVLLPAARAGFCPFTPGTQRGSVRRAHPVVLTKASEGDVAGAGAAAEEEAAEGAGDGLVLAPGSEGPGWWDAGALAMPVVLPPTGPGAPWKMWYYGREGKTWAGGRNAFLPTGVCGYAESEGGLDDVHVGVSDMHAMEGGAGYSMLYLGGSSEEVAMPGGPAGLIGLRMRSFGAASGDGVAWERQHGGAPILEPGAPDEWDSLFASWPRMLPEDPERPEGAWLMTYHALQPPASPGAPPRWAVGVARCESRAEVLTAAWEKQGRVLEGGPPGSWDERGIGTRHVIHHQGHLLMVYEAVDAGGGHSLGLARSEDCGRTWQKLTPEAPIFSARCGDAEAWDNGVVGTPWVVRRPDGGFRLYYVGSCKTEGKPSLSIGAADSLDDSLLKWKRVPCSSVVTQPVAA